MKSSMDWIVWEMLEKLKADKKILSRVRDEARAIYKNSDGDSKSYWRGILRGYERQIVWTQDNIDKLNSMIVEEQRNDEAYDNDIRQLRSAGREYIREYDDPEPTGGLWSTETGDVY